MKPIRIQRKRTKGWRMPPNTVYVGRGSKWGNLFSDKKHFPDMPTQEAIETHRAAVNGAGCIPALYGAYYEWLRPLRGKNLACWCEEGKPCHADILMEVANSDAYAD